MEHLIILGKDTQSLCNQMNEIITKYGYDADVEAIVDPELATQYGITNLPAIILDGDVVTTGQCCGTFISTLVYKQGKMKREK